MTMQDFWFTRDDVRLHAVEAGGGEVVVLLHGGMADHRAVMPYLVPLARRFRVVAPDIRGSGQSWYAGLLTFDQLAADLARLLEHVGAERPILVGVSGGTGVAVRFALSHPGRLAGLGLILPLYAGSAIGYTEQQRAIFASMDAVASQALARGIEVIRPLYANVPEEFRQQAIDTAMQFDPASVVATSHLLASGAQPFQFMSELRAIQVPTLLVRGADVMHPAEVSDAYAGALPNCRALPADTADVAQELGEFCSGCLH
jgi:pimeloyl-ACP methyl ester carboxylesterase